jgi:large subunit ribosomal protein L1
MARHGRKFREASEKVDSGRDYPPEEAIALAKEVSFEKFDATVEIHIRLGVDPRHADQQIREVVLLPHGLGKTVRVIVFAQGEGASKARDAGADYVADDDEIINKIQSGWTDFDVAIATPDMMGKVGRLGKILGPRGLMPNPKANTVVQEEDLPRTIEEAKAGRVEFRVDKTANLHIPIGKVSFAEAQLYDNLAAIMESVKRARPSTSKGTYIKRVSLSTTMGPGISVDPNLIQAMNAAD